MPSHYNAVCLIIDRLDSKALGFKHNKITPDMFTWWGTSSSYPLVLPVAQQAIETIAVLGKASNTERTYKKNSFVYLKNDYNSIKYTVKPVVITSTYKTQNINTLQDV